MLLVAIALVLWVCFVETGKFVVDLELKLLTLLHVSAIVRPRCGACLFQDLARHNNYCFEWVWILLVLVYLSVKMFLLGLVVKRVPIGLL